MEFPYAFGDLALKLAGIPRTYRDHIAAHTRGTTVPLLPLYIGRFVSKKL